MGLDVGTLSVMNVVVAFVISGVTYFFWSQHRHVRGLRGWSLGLMLCGLGWLTILAHIDAAPVMATIVGNALIVAGYSVAWLSIRRFNDDSFSLQRIVAPVLLFIAVFTLAWLAGAEMRHRIIIVSVLTGSLALLAGAEIVRDGRDEHLRGRLPTAVAFFVLGLTMIVRAGLSFHDAPLALEPGFDDPIRGVALFVTTICFIGVTLGLLMMANERLQNGYAKLASTDELTELPNRRSFLEQGNRLSRRASIDGRAACILMMDLDHFAGVNERLGHAGGDQALKAFAAVLRNGVRPADLIARYGGEEFSALLVGADAAEGARIAERIRTALAGLTIDVRGQAVNITVSTGVASLQPDDLRASIRRADEALYQAKSRGRNQVAVAPDAETLFMVPQAILA
jgi:diguanylate cyclase (GGDEF)-like protein